MAQKHLKDLLEEDQEPFYLKDYIETKKCMIIKKNSQKNTQIQLKNPSIFTKNACFLTMQSESPDLRKSPLFDFTNSPISKKSPNRVLLHVPAKTASLLLEAAIRIQQKSKPKTQIDKHSGFGLLGSMLKRLTLRNRTQKLKNTQIDDDNNNVASVSTISSSSSSRYNGKRSSSLDLESSSSSGGSLDNEIEVEFEFKNVSREVNDGDYNIGDYGALCSSPFRFSSSHVFEDNQNYEQESSATCQLEEEGEEQNSPVSVLDPPFEDDYDGHDEEEECYNQQCSYAFVRRAKQQLLHKLPRFEKLAELDPIELEKRMIEDDDEEFGTKQSNEIDEYDFESFTFANQEHSHESLEDIIAISGFRDLKKPGMKRLISDLIIEEENVEHVCKRLESWKKVECNTIDMMVEMDLREISDWKNHQSEISGTANDIEVGIFAVLVKELVMDLA